MLRKDCWEASVQVSHQPERSGGEEPPRRASQSRVRPASQAGPLQARLISSPLPPSTHAKRKEWKKRNHVTVIVVYLNSLFVLRTFGVFSLSRTDPGLVTFRPRGQAFPSQEEVLIGVSDRSPPPHTRTHSPTDQPQPGTPSSMGGTFQTGLFVSLRHSSPAPPPPLSPPSSQRSSTRSGLRRGRRKQAVGSQDRRALVM